MAKQTVSYQTGDFIEKREYEKLLKVLEPTEFQLHLIKTYEELQLRIAEGVQKNKEYLLSLVDKDFTPLEVKFTAEQLYKAYVCTFELVVGKPFDKNNQEYLDNILPMIFYFSKDERFFKCNRLSSISEPSFQKGLLVIGNYGNGKTTMMLIFEKLFKGMYKKQFKGFTTNDIVIKYEACDNDYKILEFDKIMKNGDRYFDDLCTERLASRYGKVNVMKEVLESRYTVMERSVDDPIKTYVTMNFDENHPNELEKAVEYLGEKYGSRLYDRSFKMFNIIEFKGKSFRK